MQVGQRSSSPRLWGCITCGNGAGRHVSVILANPAALTTPTWQPPHSPHSRCAQVTVNRNPQPPNWLAHLFQRVDDNAQQQVDDHGALGHSRNNRTGGGVGTADLVVQSEGGVKLSLEAAWAVRVGRSGPLPDLARRACPVRKTPPEAGCCPRTWMKV